MSLTQVKGAAWDSGNNLVADLLADLDDMAREGVVFVSGMNSLNDGNGGWFKYENTIARSTADGRNIIDPSHSGSGRGCWIRQKYFNSPDGLTFSEIQTAAAGQTLFNLQQIVYTPGNGSLAIYANGTRLTKYTYSETSPSSVTMNDPMRLGDVLEFVYKDPVGGAPGGNLIPAARVSFDNTASGMAANNVKSALEELKNAITTGVGGVINAATVALNPKAPDTSSTVQQGLHWLLDRLYAHLLGNENKHNALQVVANPVNIPGVTATDVQHVLEQLALRADAGTATKVTFDDARVGFAAANVQDAIEELDQAAQGSDGLLRDHIHDPSDAHMAQAIGLSSTVTMLRGKTDVHDALEYIATHTSGHDHQAAEVHYDNRLNNRLGNDAQTAMSDLDNLIKAHAKGGAGKHPALSISFAPTTAVPQTSVQAAVAGLGTLLDNHKVGDAVAHAATKISFSPAGGITANNVQQAIEQARAGGQQFRGIIDVTLPYAVPAPAPQNDDYWLIQRQPGVAPEASWAAVCANALPADMNVLACLLYDGAQYWYFPYTSIADVHITSLPSPGVSQSIQVADVADTALTLTGMAGQTAVVFRVTGGDAHFAGNVVADGIVRDPQGDLRQVAGTVPFNSVASGLTGAVNVQLALDQLAQQATTHEGATANRHTAQVISFNPVGTLQSTDVQGAVEEASNDLTLHKINPAAHAAASITYDDTSPAGPLGARNVQEAIQRLRQTTAAADEIDGGTY